MGITPTMAQNKWASNIFKSLDMSAIPGYPRKILPKYEKWLPTFSSNDVTIVEEHMSKFCAFFLLNPKIDDVEDLVMKIFLATLTDVTRR
jgi:hypothetical protein